MYSSYSTCSPELENRYDKVRVGYKFYITGIGS